MPAIWLREESPREVGKAGRQTLGFKAGDNEFPGQPTIRHTCSQSHAHANVTAGYLSRGNQSTYNRNVYMTPEVANVCGHSKQVSYLKV